MFSKDVIDNLDTLSRVIEKDLSIFGNYIVTDEAYFTSLKRLVSYANKVFEVEEKLKKNKNLHKIAYAYNQEDECSYPNFEWSSIRSTHLVKDNGFFDENGIFVVSSSFSMTTSWGTIKVKTGNKLVPTYTADGLDTGVIVLRRTLAPEVFSPTIDYLRPLNYNPKNPHAHVLVNITTRTSIKKMENMFLSGTIPSLLSMCKARIISKISCNRKSAKKVALALAFDVEALSSPFLIINEISVLDFVSDQIIKFSTQEADIAIRNIVDACFSCGASIPLRVTDALASRSRMPSLVDQETKNFIFNTMSTFFSIVKSSGIYVKENYGSSVYLYSGPKDMDTARMIAKKILSIDIVNTKIDHVNLETMISVVHEYMGTEMLHPKGHEGSYSFGSLSLDIDFNAGKVNFTKLDNKKMSRGELWIINPKLRYKHRINDYDPRVLDVIFSTKEDANRAIRASYALAISDILDIEYTIKIYTGDKHAYSAAHKFFSSSSYNPVHLVIKKSRILKIKGHDVGYYKEEELESIFKSKRSIIAVSKEEDADIVFRQGVVKQKDLAAVYRLSGRMPNKKYIHNFCQALDQLARMFNSEQHASDVLSSDLAMNKFMKGLSV